MILHPKYKNNILQSLVIGINTIYSAFNPDLLIIKLNMKNSMLGNFRKVTFGLA